MRAFALMRNPKELEGIFRSSPFYIRNQVAIEALRAAVPVKMVTCYRGIGRFPFTEYPQRGPGWQGEDPDYDDGEVQARALFATFLGREHDDTPYPRASLEDPREAASVRAALLRPERYELVELCSGSDSPADILGFDIGYWGGGNFSILCDAALWPTWHPAALESIPELSRHLAELNQHALFPTVEAASAFTAWYVGQDWAEGPPEDLVLVGVGGTIDAAG